MQGRVVVITDLHIKLDQLAADVDTKANFIKMLKAVSRINMDHLLITGDLCFQLPEMAVYSFVKDHLSQLEFPYSIITGNHDDPEMIVKTFGYEDWYQKSEAEIYYVKLIKERPFIFLDTKKGSVSLEQLDWLENQLQIFRGANPIIIMHYPPLLSGVPHMDDHYYLQNRNEVLDILYGYEAPVKIFTGHYHVEKTITSKNITQFITPSCFVQIDQHHSEFVPDHHIIGYRIIDFDKEAIQTGVHYLWPGKE